jgi:hypothetical protein
MAEAVGFIDKPAKRRDFVPHSELAQKNNYTTVEPVNH